MIQRLPGQSIRGTVDSAWLSGLFSTKEILGAGDMLQQLRALAACFPKDLGLIPSTDMVVFPAISASRSKGSEALLWCLCHDAHTWEGNRHTCKETPIYTWTQNKIKFKGRKEEKERSLNTRMVGRSETCYTVYTMKCSWSRRAGAASHNKWWHF